MSRTRIFLGRLKKKLHPLSVRKWLKYAAARSERYTRITPKLSAYINGLLSHSESGDVATLLSEHDKGNRAYLHVPYSEGRFLEAFVSACGAKHVLEIGTFKGYSTYFLARGTPQNGKVITVDEDARYVGETESFWRNTGVADKITFKLGMAGKVLKEMALDPKFSGYFDLVFIDADKENYMSYVESALKLTRQGGSILIDNTLWKGLVAYSRPHDNGALHMQEFNSWLMEKYGEQCALLPAWDGLSIIAKKN